MENFSKEQKMLYLIANFMDKFSLSISKNGPIQAELYKKARQVHYDMQNFLQMWDNFFNTKDSKYYDFFFENSVKESLNCEKLIDKYIEFKE